MRSAGSNTVLKNDRARYNNIVGDGACRLASRGWAEIIMREFLQVHYHLIFCACMIFVVRSFKGNEITCIKKEYICIHEDVPYRYLSCFSEASEIPHSTGFSPRFQIGSRCERLPLEFLCSVGIIVITSFSFFISTSSIPSNNCRGIKTPGLSLLFLSFCSWLKSLIMMAWKEAIDYCKKYKT